MASELSGERVAKLYKAFNDLDTNSSGFIGFSELKDILISIGKTPSDQQVKHLIKSLDKDGDDKLNFSEFLHLVAKDPQLWEACEDSEMKQLFDFFDRDKDGLLTFEEIRRALKQVYGDEVTQSEVQAMIDEADTDGDEMLNFEEFESVVKKHGGP